MKARYKTHSFTYFETNHISIKLSKRKRNDNLGNSEKTYITNFISFLFTNISNIEQIAY